MTKVLQFLHGKKTIIASIVTMTTTLLLNRGYIDQGLAEYVFGINAIIFGSAAVASVTIPKK